MSKKLAFPIGYEVRFDKNPFQPQSFHFWSKPENFEKIKPTAPLKFLADALTGLSFFKLNSFVKSPIFNPHLKFEQVTEAWNQLEPHHELFKRSAARVESLRKPAKTPQPHIQKFETSFMENFENCQKPWGIDFHEFESLLHSISWLETKLESPLLYNFNLQFSPQFLEKMHALYSFLFHLRALVAIDHNAHCEDPSHEGVKIDSITDYLPKAEYVVNDAILYYQFKAFAEPWKNRAQGPMKGDHPIGGLFVEPLEKAFSKYVHNACCLIDQLPQPFLKALNPSEMEEALYLVQMDWLLGSPAGLLFRIREEIYGLTHGYNSVFWQETEVPQSKGPSALSVSVDLSPNLWKTSKAA